MTLCRAVMIVACGWLAATVPAAAQAQTPANQQACAEFAKLNKAAETSVKALQAAGQKKTKPTAQEACKLFSSYAASLGKLLALVERNDLVWCGLPPDAAKQIKVGHQTISRNRDMACKAAAAPPRPRGPSLSDALGAPVPSANNVKPGRGTFDTLTGSPLTR